MPSNSGSFAAVRARPPIDHGPGQARQLLIQVTCASLAGARASHALRRLLEMSAEAITPDVFSHNVALSTCAKMDLWTTAMSLFQEVRLKIQPDVISYNAALSAYGAGHKWAQCIHLLFKIQEKSLHRSRRKLKLLRDQHHCKHVRSR